MGIVTALDLVAKQVGDLFLVEFPGEIEVFFRLPSYKQITQYALLLQQYSHKYYFLRLLLFHLLVIL